MARPPKVTRTPVVTHQKQSVKDVLQLIPAKMVAQMKENKKLDTCCQDVFNHQVELSKTHDDAKAPDRAVFECSCGKKHIRIAVGGAPVQTSGSE